MRVMRRPEPVNADRVLEIERGRTADQKKAEAVRRGIEEANEKFPPILDKNGNVVGRLRATPQPVPQLRLAGQPLPGELPDVVALDARLRDLEATRQAARRCSE